MNEPLFSLSSSKVFRVEIALVLSFNIENNLVFLVAHVLYHTVDTTPPDQIMMEIKVQNVFEIDDLKTFLIEANEIKLPADIITSFVGLSISHTRALMAKNIAGTLLQDNLMGIVNPEHMAKHFFPKMFNIETELDTKIEQPKKEIKKAKVSYGKNPPSKHSY
jgi:hypothetical protein